MQFPLSYVGILHAIIITGQNTRYVVTSVYRQCRQRHTEALVLCVFHVTSEKERCNGNEINSWRYFPSFQKEKEKLCSISCEIIDYDDLRTSHSFRFICISYDAFSSLTSICFLLRLPHSNSKVYYPCKADNNMMKYNSKTLFSHYTQSYNVSMCLKNTVIFTTPLCEIYTINYDIFLWYTQKTYSQCIS